MKERRIKVMSLMLTGPLRPELLFCSIATAAEYLEVSERHLLKLCSEGKLERVRLVDRKDVEIGVGVLEDSLKAYRKRHQTKRQLDLIPNAT